MAEGTDDSEAREEEPAGEAQEEGPASKHSRSYEESVAARSDTDAMGNDKRRAVIGGQYGASVRKRLLFYGVAVGIIVALVILSFTVVKNVDEKEIALEPTAPWATTEAELEAPRDLDFIRNGPSDAERGDATIPPEDIVNR